MYEKTKPYWKKDVDPIVRLMTKESDIEWKTGPDTKGNPRTRFKRLTGPEFGSKQMVVGLMEVIPGRTFHLHHHEDAEEFYYVLKGKAKVTLDDEEFEATPGTFFYIPAGCPHRTVNHTNEPFVVIYGLNCTYYRRTWDESH